MRYSGISKIAFILLGLSIGGFAYAHFDMQRNTNNNVGVDKKYDRSRLFKFEIDSTLEQTKARALEQYKICPPLHPDRFRRRVKILWGIDINDYPEDAIIWYSGYRFYSRYQIIEGDSVFEAGPWQIEVPSEELYIAARSYMFYDDIQAYNMLKEDYEVYKDHDIGNFRDFMLYLYMSAISPYPQLIRYIGSKNTPYPPYKLNLLIQNPDVGSRISDTRNNLHTLYVLEQLQQGRPFINSENGLFNAIPIHTSEIIYPYIFGYEAKNNPTALPWRQKDLCERNLCANLSFLLQWHSKDMKKRVIQFMTGQLNDSYLTSEYVERIRSNNYYGYTLLREFCENTEREMPTLEKVGTSFNVKVVQPKTLLYLEPYPDSYDIDTMQPSEVFRAYEMGYDDYYFVEVIKPVESPVAGPDGYAIILDRTETVYGYIRKSEVKEVSESEIEYQKIMSKSGERKLGRIDDPDGYVNIRKESNSESEAVGKIEEKELFFYWEIADSNWWYVETKDSVKGFVHKSRIKEKTDAGGWIIDE